MAKHRAKAKVLLDDIGFPQNEVMKKIRSDQKSGQTDVWKT
jgi:hypothetical protein